MNQVNVKVDGVGLNATHFSAMSEQDAIKAMSADGISNDSAWSKKAYTACQKAVADATKAKEEADKLADDKKKKVAVKEGKPEFLRKTAG
jgi:hypothetical protein